MASGSHTGQSESRAMAAPSHSGYTCEEKVGVFCFVWKQRQLPNKALNLPSIQIAGSQLLSQIFRSKLPTSALPSPALQRVSLQRFFFDETLSKKDAWNTQEQKGSVTPEFAEKTALILGVLLINKRRKGFQVLYTVQKKKEFIKMQGRFKCYLENKNLRKKDLLSFQKQITRLCLSWWGLFIFPCNQKHYLFMFPSNIPGTNVQISLYAMKYYNLLMLLPRCGCTLAQKSQLSFELEKALC